MLHMINYNIVSFLLLKIAANLYRTFASQHVTIETNSLNCLQQFFGAKRNAEVQSFPVTYF